MSSLRPDSRIFPESLVDKDGGLVSRNIFIDPEIYQRELSDIFAVAWLFLGHESQLPNPNDFFTTFMGEDPVIVARTRAGKLTAHLNSCLHRGMKLCRAESGNAKNFTCPYHAWTYSNDGTLVGVPGESSHYRNELDKERWRLPQVAHIDTYRGLIFATWNQQAPPLLEELGPMAALLDTAFDLSDAGMEVLGGIHKWRAKTNWKLPADNQSGDLYHVPWSHGGTLKASGQTPSFEVLGPQAQFNTGEGHGFAARFLMPDGEEEPVCPMQSQVLSRLPFYQNLRSQREQRHGKLRARLNILAGTIFPNFSFLPTSNTIRVTHPRGPGEVEVWSWCIIERGAPPEVRAMVKRMYGIAFGPAGMIEQDDSENWEEVWASSRGRIAREYPFNYQLGLGHEQWHEGLSARVGDVGSEMNQRSFYRRWARMMGEGE